MGEPNYDLILKAKIDYYGETKAAYEFAANEFAEQKVSYMNLPENYENCSIEFAEWCVNYSQNNWMEYRNSNKQELFKEFIAYHHSKETSKDGTDLNEFLKSIK